MSIGEPHVETDKTGALVNCYDVVLSPRFVRKTVGNGNQAHFTFLLHMIYQGLGSKYQIEFRDSWIKLQNKKYFVENVETKNKTKPEISQKIEVKACEYVIKKTGPDT